MNFIGAFLIFLGLNAFAESPHNTKNTSTRYRTKKPAGVCFETSVDKYLIKKQHTVSELMLYFKLSPLWCENCSVETAQTINKIENIDVVKPGQILIIPQKCANFSWKDEYDYNKLPEYSDEDMKNIIKKRNAGNSTEAETTTAAATPPTNPLGTSSTIITNKKTVVSYNKVGAEPFGFYSEITGASSAFQTRLLTDFARGVKVYYQRNLTTAKELFVNASIYQTELKADLSTTTVNEKSQSPFAAQVGLKNYINTDWALSLMLGFEENLFFDQTVATAVTVKKAMNTDLKISPDYIFYRKEKWTMNASAGLGLLLPTSAPSSTAKPGALLDTEIKATRKLDFGRVYAGLAFAHRLQNSDTVDYKDNALIYKVGTYYLF